MQLFSNLVTKLQQPLSNDTDKFPDSIDNPKFKTFVKWTVKISTKI